MFRASQKPPERRSPAGPDNSDGPRRTAPAAGPDDALSGGCPAAGWGDQRGPNRWEGTRVHVKQGVLKPEAVTIPIGLLDLFKAKAEHSAESMDKMSTAQRDKVENVLAGNPERFVASKQFAAMEADVRMFGLDAALWKDRS